MGQPPGRKPEASKLHAAAAGLEEKLGYQFRDRGLLRQALTHRSWEPEGGRGAEGGDNERLEFLGDSVLGLRISERLLAAFPQASEGQLSRLRAWLVSARHLAAAAERLELGHHLRMSRGEEAFGGRSKQRLLANTLEAVLGAIHLDGGFAAAGAVIDATLLGAGLDPLALEHLHEFAYKSALQEWAHANGRELPRYRVLSATGPEHGKVFTVEVALGEVFTGTASGASKKEAEQRAAAQALTALGLLP